MQAHSILVGLPYIAETGEYFDGINLMKAFPPKEHFIGCVFNGCGLQTNSIYNLCTILVHQYHTV